MNWRTFSPSFALGGGGFYLTVPSGDRPAWIWESPTKRVVTICHSLRGLTPRGLSIAVRIVVRSSRESVVCAGQWPALPAATNTTAASSICDFGYACVVPVSLSSRAKSRDLWLISVL